MVTRLEHCTFKSYDTTEIAYQKVGEGRPLVMANGLGGTFAAWRHLYSRLAKKWKVLCWDYRGLYGSGPPSSLDTLSIPNQCRDLERLLEVENVEDSVFMGWSMGSQVCLEFYREHGDRFKGMVLLNGTYGRPFDTVMGTRMFRDIIPKLLQMMDLAAPLINIAVGAAGKFPLLVPTLQSVGLVGRTLDMKIFSELAVEFAKLDFHIYAQTLDALGRHDAEDVLKQVKCPVCVITGDRDVMTPVKTAEAMVDALENAKLHVIEGASHYAAVEYPDKVGDIIERFLEDVFPSGVEIPIPGAQGSTP